MEKKRSSAFRSLFPLAFIEEFLESLKIIFKKNVIKYQHSESENVKQY